MRVLVTGGLGYIGSRITRALLDRGHSAVVVDRGTYDSPLVREYVSGASIVNDDIRSALAKQDDGYDWCFHLAALSNDGSADLSVNETNEVNVLGTAAVVDLCARTHTPLIFASTASVYGHVEWALSREDSYLNPQSIYAESKVAAERLIREAHAKRGLHCVILRQATVFGWSPRMRYDLVVNTLLKSALATGTLTAQGGGECWRPLIYVGDLAETWCRIAENATSHWWAAQDGCPVFNLVHKNYRISELIWWMTLLLRDWGIECEMVRASMQSTDNRDYAMDGSRAVHAGYASPTGITQAIDEMLRKIDAGITADFDNPIYNNVAWLKSKTAVGRASGGPPC